MVIAGAVESAPLGMSSGLGKPGMTLLALRGPQLALLERFHRSKARILRRHFLRWKLAALDKRGLIGIHFRDRQALGLLNILPKILVFQVLRILLADRLGELIVGRVGIGRILLPDLVEDFAHLNRPSGSSFEVFA
jgi:hypothetical protein